MTITQILSQDEVDVSATEKLLQVAQVVTQVRSKYGNTGLDISIPEIPTVSGCTPLSLLSDEDKLVLVAGEIAQIKVFAYENAQAVEGAVIERNIEALIATNALLVNLSATIQSDYI